MRLPNLRAKAGHLPMNHPKNRKTLSGTMMFVLKFPPAEPIQRRNRVR
jgi:hypothetical protein